MTALQDLPPPTNKTPVPYLTIAGTTFGLLLPVLAVALLYWTTGSTTSEPELSLEQKLRELQASEERQMTTYDWVEKPSKDKPGVTRVPVARARELVLNELHQKETKR